MNGKYGNSGLDGLNLWLNIFRCCSSGDGGNSIVKALLCIETAFGVCLLCTDSDVPKDKDILNYEMHLHLRIYMHLHHIHIMSISKSIPLRSFTYLSFEISNHPLPHDLKISRHGPDLCVNETRSVRCHAKIKS